MDFAGSVILGSSTTAELSVDADSNLMDTLPTNLLQFLSAVYFYAEKNPGPAVTLLAFTLGLLQYRQAQRLQRARYIAEQIEKLYLDESLWLGMRFLEWHDRDIALPPKYANYGDKGGRFHHRLQYLRDAMSVQNRVYNEETKIYDLKEEFRTYPYTLYVEVFDRFFDFLSEVQVFKHQGLVKNRHLMPIEYIVRRMDALQLFNEYIKEYELKDIQALITSFRARKPVSWIASTSGAMKG